MERAGTYRSCGCQDKDAGGRKSICYELQKVESAPLLIIKTQGPCQRMSTHKPIEPVGGYMRVAHENVRYRFNNLSGSIEESLRCATLSIRAQSFDVVFEL